MMEQFATTTTCRRKICHDDDCPKKNLPPRRLSEEKFATATTCRRKIYHNENDDFPTTRIMFHDDDFHFPARSLNNNDAALICLLLVHENVTTTRRGPYTTQENQNVYANDDYDTSTIP